MAAYSDTVGAKICDAIRIGAYQKEAAQYARIGENTLCTWLRRGRADIARGDEDTPHARLVADVEQAEAEACIRALAVIHRAAVRDGDWRAATTWMARRHPDRWGERGQVAVQVETVDPASIELDHLIREAKAKQAAEEEALRRGENTEEG